MDHPTPANPNPEKCVSQPLFESILRINSETIYQHVYTNMLLEGNR